MKTSVTCLNMEIPNTSDTSPDDNIGIELVLILKITKKNSVVLRKMKYGKTHRTIPYIQNNTYFILIKF